VFLFKDKPLARNVAHVMGVLNVTPDSFSDGGAYNRLDSALRQAEKMIVDGASIVDVGGESTRPGAKPVSSTEELDRVLPVIEALTANVDTIISVDTSTPEVMVESAKLGAHLINDVRALQRQGAMEAAVLTGLPVCLMHMQGQPESMQESPEYIDVVNEVRNFFSDRISECVHAGIDRDQIILDPGFGFGKALEHNLRLVNRMSGLAESGLPLLVGMSRKSMIGAVLNKPVDQRLAASLALASAAVMNGAWIVRAHDVAETVDVVRMLNAVRLERL